MIYTVTFNPSLDYVVKLDALSLGKTNRSYQERIYPGGKGFNVSTILHRLDIPTTALGFVGGFVGNEIEKQLQIRGVQCDLCYLNDANSRINVKIKVDQETEINGSGPVLSKKDIQALLEKLNLLTNQDWLVLAGSVPSSLPSDIYAIIMDYLHDKKIPIVVDASGKLLKNVLSFRPFLIKPNRDELEEFFGHAITSKKILIQDALALKQMGARNVLVSLGKDGALLVSENGTVYECPAAKGRLKNSVGAGDSMIAGFIAGYIQQGSYLGALKLGSACGGATAFNDDLASRKEIEDVYKTLEISECDQYIRG